MGCGDNLAASPRIALSAFHFTFKQRSAEQQVKLLSSLGYSGIALSSVEPNALSELLAVHDVTSHTFGVHAAIHTQQLGEPVPDLTETLGQLRDAGAALWVVFLGEGNDAAIAAKLTALANSAQPFGVPVIVYPHEGTALRSAEEAVRWINLAGTTDVKTSLHLCHEMKAGNRDRLAEVIGHVLPHMSLVTLNGADREVEPGNDWRRTIQPLDRGDFDVREQFLQPLLNAGYPGPFILHTFGIADAPESHLRRSINQWREWVR